MKFGSPIDLLQNELQNARIQNLSTPPATPVAGQIYYNTTANRLYFWNGTEWVSIEKLKDFLNNQLFDTNSITLSYDATTIWADFRNNSTGLADQKGTLTVDVNGVSVDLDRNLNTKAMPGGTHLNEIPLASDDVSLNSHKITNLLDPTAAQDAATKNYVDSAVQVGTNEKLNVVVATTGSITHSGLLIIDGYQTVAGDRILDKDNSTPALNGIWVVASGAWSRSSDANTWNELVSAHCFVQKGTVNADTGWLCIADPGGTLGTNDVIWTQISAVGQIVAGNGLSKTGQQLDVNVDSQSIEIVSDILQAKLDIAGAITKTASGIKINIDAQSFSIVANALTAKLNAAGAIQKDASGLKVGVDGTTIEINANALRVKDGSITATKLATSAVDLAGMKVTGTLPIANGGTGATTTAGARANLAATGKYATAVGDGTATSFVITHNLNTQDISVSVRYAATPFAGIICDWEATTVNTATIRFAVAPTASQFRVVIVG
ncbi:MAG: hypothetical protein ABFD61_02700 [Chloroherpetonaceae bacterium]